jgi:hypothetical protein
MKNWMVYVSGVLFFAIILIVLIVMFVRRDNKPDKPSNKPSQSQQQTQSKLKQVKSAGGSVEFKTSGEVVGEENHRAIRITVSSSERTLEVLSGYDEQVVSTQSSPNTQSAYEAFIDALDGAQFGATKQGREEMSEKTACPLGLHYEYVMNTSSGDESKSWATSCSRADGTFSGNSNVVRTLFQNQIPDYRKYVSGVRLNL